MKIVYSVYMIQERHLVYEYWVSTDEKAASTLLERETAELIETLVCLIELLVCLFL